MPESLFGKRLHSLRLLKKISLQKLADDLNAYASEHGILTDNGSKITISKSMISRWESGLTDPKMLYVRLITKYFNVSPSAFIDENWTATDETIDSSVNHNLFVEKPDISSIYDRLNPDRQQNVYNYADNQLKEQNGKVVNLPLVGKSAANPTELTYGDVEIEHDDFTDVPHGADTAIRIQGDSMEPLIHDGQIIFYHRQEEVENGEIAIVEIDGDGVTCKQIYYDYTSDEVILRSINKKYEPRHVKDDQVRIIGKVIL
ncbi:multidrug transporter [Lactiplantibacillus pentosus]|uniref:helix-turn-helix domain-containing protein n=1 Tax=Lactiplantibacillus pentosus TaxID=1589 RepID=UPI000D01BD89|nr:XRE family transcriptional regulator [Lactiplantibacillus pentosus]MCT3304183.1 LexA family transcriptional regulator [Lactiplantibacillus pentosus]PRO75668.1 multidrug transporter [Lactiplantibacillus pentosus]PRO79075.1 multidrug transporter [Lactiplantibacillus pentosus]PRO87386.1 multidrug transporter [Lactiplantibacillus pentosus]